MLIWSHRNEGDPSIRFGLLLVVVHFRQFHMREVGIVKHP